MIHDGFIFTRLEWIDPIQAKAYLGHSAGNRGMKAEKISAYARDMTAGRWIANGESLIFDEAGNLIDGHHRLQACILSQTAFRSVVVRGVPSESSKTIDMGANRSPADALAFYGYKNCAVLNSVVRVLMSLKNGRERSASPSMQEVLSFLEANPDLQEAANFGHASKFPKLQAMIGAIWFIARLQDREDDAAAFREVFKTGIPSRDGCPAHALRERILRGYPGGKHVTIREAQLLCVAAWEKFASGAVVRSLRAPSAFKITGYD